MGDCGDSSEIFIKLSNFSLHGFRKRAAFVLNDSKSEGWEKIGNVSLESCGPISEEARRIQDPVQFRDRT